MQKREFVQRLLGLLDQFLPAKEEVRQELGKKIAHFVQRNHKFTNGKDAFTDPGLRMVTFLAELREYSKYTFPEEDFQLAHKALKKVAKG